jgi:hypothetical protein
MQKYKNIKGQSSGVGLGLEFGGWVRVRVRILRFLGFKFILGFFVI